VFDVISIYPTPTGRFRVTIETSDAEAAFFASFFGEAAKAADAFRYRFRVAQGVLRLNEHIPAALNDAKETHARYLALFRTLTGPRGKRISVLRRMLAADGIKISHDKLSGAISAAIKDKRGQTATAIIQGRANGLSLRELAKQTGLSVGTVKRYSTLSTDQPISESPPAEQTIHTETG
jgi:lambda repressor-like predicted transcriptional regulator